MPPLADLLARLREATKSLAERYAPKRQDDPWSMGYRAALKDIREWGKRQEKPDAE